MIHRNAFGFVQRNECTNKEHLMFLFKRKGKTIDDTAQDFQKLSYAIMFLSLKNEPVKDVVDCFPDEGTMYHKLAIYSV